MIEREAVPISGMEIVHEADLLYRGQSHVFRIPVPATGFDGPTIRTSLAGRYKQRFAIELEEITPILANLRTTVFGRRKPIDMALFGRGLAQGNAAPETHRPVRFNDVFVDTPIYAREALGQSSTISGPAIVQQSDATVVINPGARAQVDALGNLIIDI
jgi:N-methylhydantoinase A